MKSNIAFNVGHLLAGTIVGYLVYKLSGEHTFTVGLLSIGIALLTIIMLEVMLQPFLIRKEYLELTSRVNYLANKMADRSADTADIVRILRHGSICVPASKTIDVWLELNWSTRNRYWGILYVSPKEIARTSVFDLALAIMSAKVRVNQVDIKRIFLFETQEDFEDSSRAMRACIEHNIPTRYCFASELKEHLLLQEKILQLKTLDFAVIDSQVVWLTFIDKKRFETGGEFHFDSQMNEHYSEIFRLIWEASIPYIPKNS